MKKTKLFLVLAVVLALGSAFAAPKLQTYNFYRYSITTNSWELEEGPYGFCDDDPGQMCGTWAETQPPQGSTPAVIIYGHYIR